MFIFAGLGAIAYLAHNAWWQHRELERAHRRIDQLQDKLTPAAPAAK